MYQSVFSPFIPLLVDNNEVDTVICKFLERAAIRESMGSLIFDGPVTQLELAEAAMLMAALGRGVQVSDLDADTRTRLSREYSRRAFHLARLANFMLRPNLQTLQALLLVQNVMQNAGQPDAAWCLLGTLIRLAQSIGLHQHPGATVSPSDQARYSRIWCVTCIVSVFTVPLTSKQEYAFMAGHQPLIVSRSTADQYATHSPLQEYQTNLDGPELPRIHGRAGDMVSYDHGIVT